MKSLTGILGFVLLFSICSFSQEEDPSLFKFDTLKVRKKFQIVGLPIVFYTPETSVGFGAGTQLFLHRQANIYNARESNILVTAIYTLNSQFIIDARPKIYFQFGDWMMDGCFKYKIFPSNFWGIGNFTPDSNEESYNMESFEVSAAFLKYLPPSLNFGLEYVFADHKMLEIKEGGILDTSGIPGSRGCRASGIFVVFNLDNRDNIFFPYKGNFMQIKAGFASKVLGSTYSYNKFIIDLRKYIRLTRTIVLASQIYLEDGYGTVPFQSKSYLGGPERNRGYYKGRYIDDHLGSAQVEVRWRFTPRWVLAGFASGGEVSSLPWDYFRDLKFSFGGGIRYQLLKKAPTLLRFDAGIGEDGNLGFYFSVNEAF